MDYDYIKAACAESGDLISLTCLTNNKSVEITLPSDDEIAILDLPLYSEIMDKQVSKIIIYNDKTFKIVSIIKPDVPVQYNMLIHELASFLNSIFHFGFLADYFSYYISDCLCDICSKDEIDAILSSNLRLTAARFKESLLKKSTEEFTDKDNSILSKCLYSFHDKYKNIETVVSSFFSDLACTIDNILHNSEYFKLTENDLEKLKYSIIYAYTAAETAEKIENIFAENMWNSTNMLLSVKLINNKFPGRKSICLEKANDVKPYYYSMSLLEYVTITSEIKEIPEGMFYCNMPLSGVVFEEGSAEVIQSKAFESTMLTNISLPLSTRYIGKQAFAKCSIKTLIIPPRVEKIDEYAFKDCKDLIEVIILSEKTNIADTAFEGCNDKISIKTYCYNASQDVNILSDDKTIDVISPVYLIKNNINFCPICKKILELKDCIIKYRGKSIKIQLLYCGEHKSYYINKSIMNKYEINSGCSVHPFLPVSNIVDIFNISNITVIPKIPYGIIVKRVSSGEYCISYQILKNNEDLIIEINPISINTMSARHLMLKQVLINNEEKTLPITISSNELKSISTEICTLFMICMDFPAGALNVSCDGTFIKNMQLIEKGKCIDIYINDSFTEKDLQKRVIEKVFVNEKKVKLPYSFIVENDTKISVEYYGSFYVYADKRLKITSAEFEIEMCENNQEKYNKYRIANPTIAEITSFDSSVCNVRSIVYHEMKYTLPAKVKLEQQSYISVGEIDKIAEHYKLKILSSHISIYRNGAILSSENTINKGDVLSAKLSGVSSSDYMMLCNGKALTYPYIVVVDYDVTFELISKKVMHMQETLFSSVLSEKEPQFNSKSFLGDMGYSTSLSASKRYEILQKAVRIYGKTKVINFLEYLIRGRTAQINGAVTYENAISVWRFDIQRVRNM